MVSLCASCHEEVGKQVATATVRHGAVETAGRCLNCHSPHAADQASLLVRPPVLLCVACHSRDTIQDGKGRRLTNMKALLDERPVVHRPVKEGTCTGCHQPHGGKSPRLLVAHYTTELYAAWEPGQYALCFKCHDRKVFETPETRTLTRFRDGARNLHYVHVRQQRGRTCRACHEVHASQQPHLLRTAVPYGSRGWSLKLRYTGKENGGACAKTCHQERGYDRTRG
jgi:predicted CXXCH cytochrome family protein